MSESDAIPVATAAVSPLRVAVIGYGGWGRCHLKVYRNNPRTELIAVCGRDPSRVKETARAYGAHPYTNVGQMLAQTRPDLVSVVLPDEAHFGPCAGCLLHPPKYQARMS